MTAPAFVRYWAKRADVRTFTNRLTWRARRNQLWISRRRLPPALSRLFLFLFDQFHNATALSFVIRAHQNLAKMF
jgi:hypothetical protein